jgi:hypothetical protein
MGEPQDTDRLAGNDKAANATQGMAPENTDHKSESQNVKDDNGRPFNRNEELDQPPNKANQGKDETVGIP